MTQAMVRKILFSLGHIVMLVGLLCSKALVSIGSVTIVVSAIIYVYDRPSTILHPPRQIAGFLVLFIVPFISGIWSANLSSWIEVTLNKVMLPALAWAYWLAPPMTKKEYYWLIQTNVTLVLAGTFYSIGHYILSTDLINESYLRAKTLKVLYLDDHLHFSLWIIVTMALILHDWQILTSFGKKYGNMIFSGIMIWLIIFLHVLGAKTGLILFYLGLFYLTIHHGWWKVKSTYRWFIPPIALVLMAAAYFFIPTLKNRIYYTLYDFNQYVQGSFINGLTDGARVLSWKAGSEIATAHPWLGIGYGDLHDVFQEWHATHSRHLESYNWLQPSDEWLMYWCGSGWLGMVMLSLGLWWIYHYSGRKKDRIYQFVFLAQILMMWYEVNLSNQIGITLFVFSLSWFHIASRIAPPSEVMVG